MSGHPDATPRHTNRLAAETSPYLLQHAHNPVDWYPWGPEALARARDEGKPIFLSVGYAACHWCHVMAHESFEDEATAAVLNAHFVAVKVDREERPDIDAIYMDAVQQMTGQGGWPMSVFLTPDGKPFYGGTYFPDAPRHGMPSFRDILHGVHRAWTEQREEVERAGDRLVHAIDEGSRALSAAASAGGSPATVPVEGWMLDAAVVALERSFDARHGGWGGAPKFPQPMLIEALLREHVRTGDARPLAIARRTLDAMAAGGIYDHLGGGFARYATDAVWLVPHFEKMLYDNAQLARVYTHAWQVTGEPGYRRVATETLDHVARDLRVPPDGAFASSLDADTEGEEGLTYVWTAEEVRDALGDDAELFSAAYGVTPAGNWEGRTILSRVRPTPELADRLGLAGEEVERRLASARRILLERRSARPQPARDDKVLTAWNGLMIAAYADAASAFGSDAYARIATEAATFIVERSLDANGRPLRSWKDGRALHTGVLEDHTHLADGLLALYEATFDERWFTHARGLMDAVLEHFADPAGGFFDTSDEHEQLITRPKGLQDNAVPSGGAVAASVLLRLAAWTGEARYDEAARAAIGVVAQAVPRYPTAFGQWLQAMQLAVVPVDEVAIVGDLANEATRALLDVAMRGYRPFQVVAVGAGAATSAVPLLRDRTLVDGAPAAYVCRRFACRRPVTDAEALASELSAPR